MSSIRERAAALRLAEKLQLGPPGPGAAVAAPPPSSASIWTRLIARLRVGVTVKRRLLHLRSHSDCFLGAEAADVVADHIAAAEGLEGAAASRDKVVCVCQALLDGGVFEAVGTKMFSKAKKKDAFEDSRSALYRFVGGASPSVEQLERGALAGGIQKLFCSDPPHRLDDTADTPLPATLMESGPAPKVTSERPSRERTDPELPQSLVEEVWQEQTLLRLLNLVELPLLEGVLQCSQSPAHPQSVSCHLDRQVLQAFRSSQDDEWLCRALDCVDFLPDPLVAELSSSEAERSRRQLLDGGQPLDRSIDTDGGPNGDDLVQWKLLLFGTLVRHYGAAGRPPLLPQKLADVYAAITDLLVYGRLDVALEALQLCLKLLPPSGREELRRLLTLMSTASEPLAVKLDKEVENRLAVRRAFSKAVLHTKTVPKEKEDLLLGFMLSNIQDVFKTPASLHKVVSEKLAALARGPQPDTSGSSPGAPASGGDYADCVKRQTQQELWALLNSIQLDAKMAAKEKKHLLRQFYLAHPEIFNQYYGEDAAAGL